MRIAYLLFEFCFCFWIELQLPYTIFLFVTATSTLEIPKKANMFYLNKEATSKDEKLKMQMLVPTDGDSKNTEYVWKCNGLFCNQKGELTLFKKDFPKNTLIYINQETISTVKGDLGIYLVNVVLGQVLPMIGCPPDIDNYVCGENEVKMFLRCIILKLGNLKASKNC